MRGRTAGLLLVAIFTAVCGASPTTPASSDQRGGGPPAAAVRPSGTLTFPSCAADGTCTFQGEVTNDGPDCASNVRGVTRLFDASGQELEAKPWEILGRVRRGATSFTGCCFVRASVENYRTYRTDATFEPLLCV